MPTARRLPARRDAPVQPDQRMAPAPAITEPVKPIIVCADDYGISAGVTRGILELAAIDRLSALSAMVTLPRWPEDAPLLGAVRDRLSVGLHLNFTLGQPLTRMPKLAPTGQLPSIGQLTKATLLGQICPIEIEAETKAQIEAFRSQTGDLPDHIDGHQHAHALPFVRNGVLGAISSSYRHFRPLVRDPSDTLPRILSRRSHVIKALSVRALATGFGALLRRAGLPFNEGFSGFSPFDRSVPFEDELLAAMRHPGPFHMAMCHPGYADDELATLDPVTDRREDELRALKSSDRLASHLRRISRRPDGTIDWQRLP